MDQVWKLKWSATLPLPEVSLVISIGREREREKYVAEPMPLNMANSHVCTTSSRGLRCVHC